MTFRGHVSRAEIGLRKPESRSYNIWPERGGVTGHWAGPAQKVSLLLSGHTRCIALWKGYQTYHMDEHGWVDIAYTLGACQHGYLLAGRGANVRTGANGTNDGNNYWYAICAIIGEGEVPTVHLMDAFWAGVKMLRADGNAGPGINEHSDHKSTTCAGTFGDAIKTKGEPDMADHNHELTEMPDWGGVEKRYWAKFVADGVTSVKDSWKRPVWRLDLSWLYSETIVPLQDAIKAQRSQISNLKSSVSTLKSQVADLMSSGGGGLTEAQVRAIAKDEINKSSIQSG